MCEKFDFGRQFWPHQFVITVTHDDIDFLWDMGEVQRDRIQRHIASKGLQEARKHPDKAVGCQMRPSGMDWMTPIHPSMSGVADILKMTEKVFHGEIINDAIRFYKVDGSASLNDQSFTRLLWQVSKIDPDLCIAFDTALKTEDSDGVENALCFMQAMMQDETKKYYDRFELLRPRSDFIANPFPPPRRRSFGDSPPI